MIRKKISGSGCYLGVSDDCRFVCSGENSRASQSGFSFPENGGNQGIRECSADDD